MASSMTFAALQDLVRDLCFEQTADNGLFSAAQLQRYVQMAHRRLYTKVAELCPSIFQVRSADKTITSTGLAIGGSSLDTEGLEKITMVELKYDLANYRRLEPIAYGEKDYVEGPTWQLGGSSYMYMWTLDGFTLRLYPQPSDAKTIRITYVAAPKDLTDAAPAVEPFGGNLRSYHELIGYRAAQMALSKDESSGYVKAEYESLLKDFVTHLRRRQVQTPRRVLRTGTD